MKRRTFIGVALGVAAQAAVVPTCLLADDGDDWKYYEAFRERLIRLCKEHEYEVKWCRLSPIRDNRRFVAVFHARGVVEFWMDWR